MSKRHEAPVITTEEGRSFWDKNPLCASIVPGEHGSAEWFERYDRLREEIEPLDYSYALHEFRQFRGRRVLDVGCGNGYVLSKFAKEGALVSGVDVTPAGIAVTRKRFDMLGLEGDLRVADAQELPFEDGSFDCVTSMGVLHHVPDTEKAVSEILRVLKPGGRFIIMMYHRNSVQYQIKYRLVSLVKRRPIQELVNEFDGVGNPKGDVYSRKELLRLLAGFRDHEFQVGFLEPLMFTRRIGNLVPKALLPFLGRRFGWNLYAKCRKPGAERSDRA